MDVNAVEDISYLSEVIAALRMVDLQKAFPRVLLRQDTVRLVNSSGEHSKQTDRLIAC